jgi:cytochrome P450
MNSPDSAVDGPTLDGKTITFSDPAIHRCPYSAYNKLRGEAPVYRDPVTGNYVLTRYEDVRKAVLTPRTLSSKTGLGAVRINAATDAVNEIYDKEGWRPLDTILSNDPPSHRFYRQLVEKAFVPRTVEAMEPRIAEIVEELLAQFLDKPEVDFVAEFANKLPMRVIAEEINIAPKDMAQLKLWADVSIESQDPTMTYERELEVARILTQMQQYMKQSIEQIRAHPDGRLLSRVVHAELEGRHLDMRELMSVLQQLIVGGSDTTTAALGGGMKLLIENPQVPDQLREEPELMRAFVEEVLRLAAPLQTMFRRAAQDIEIQGVKIPKDSIVEVRFGSANRDPEVYPDPERLDLRRSNPRPQLAFGAGPHTCIGNQLARGELRVAFTAIIDRMKEFRFSRGEDSVDYTPLYVSNGLTKLWMSFTKR